MGKFNKLLDATFDPPKTWKLNSSLSFDSTVPLNDVQVKVLRAVGVRISLKGRIAVPKNFKTDLASVPRPAWAVCSPFDIARAAVIHDYIYWCIRKYRAGEVVSKSLYKEAKKIGDDVFKDGMESAAPAVPGWKIGCAYHGVRAFGRWSIIPRKEL